MLTIREAQRQAFRLDAAVRFECRLADHFQEFFPRQCDFLGRERVLAAMHACRLQAEAREFSAQREIGLYISLMFLLGADFESDPQLPWTSAALAAPGAPFARLTRLYEAASEYLDCVAGEENEHLVRALARLRAHDIRSFESTDPARLDEELLARLAWLYPQKAAAQGEEANRAAIRQGFAVARRHGLEGATGASLCVGMVFFLGSRFDRDPLVAWAAEALGGRSLSADEKIDRLHGTAMEFLTRALS
jgi:hypothetical protein